MTLFDMKRALSKERNVEFYKKFQVKKISDKHYAVARIHNETIDLNMGETLFKFLDAGNGSFYTSQTKENKPMKRKVNPTENVVVLFPTVDRHPLNTKEASPLTAIFQPLEVVVHNERTLFTFVDNHHLINNLPYYFFKTHPQRETSYFDQHSYCNLINKKKQSFGLSRSLEQDVQKYEGELQEGKTPDGTISSFYTLILKSMQVTTKYLCNTIKN